MISAGVPLRVCDFGRCSRRVGSVVRLCACRVERGEQVVSLRTQLVHVMGDAY